MKQHVCIHNVNYILNSMTYKEKKALQHLLVINYFMPKYYFCHFKADNDHLNAPFEPIIIIILLAMWLDFGGGLCLARPSQSHARKHS